MGFLDFAKAAYHQVNPFDSGRTYRSHYDAKRRREEEEWRNRSWGNSGSNISVGVANPNQNVTVEKPRPKKPVNIFEDLNKNLVLNKPKNTLEVIKNENTKVAPKLKPGTVVKPTLKVDVARPKQRIVVPKKRDKFRRPATPEDIVNRGLDRGESWEEIAHKNRLSLEGVKQFSQATRPDYGITINKPKQGLFDRVRDVFDANTEADKFRRQEEKKPINYRNSVVDFVKRNLSPTGTFNIGKEVVQGAARFPIELATLPLSAISRTRAAEEAKKRGEDPNKAADEAPYPSWQPSGWQKRLFGDAPVKPLNKTAEDVSKFIEESTGRKPHPAALVAGLLGISAIPGVRGGLKAGARKGSNNLEDISELLETEASRPKPIKVAQNIPVDETEVLPQPVRVRSLNEPGPVIKEFPGDEDFVTPDALARRNAEEARGEAGIRRNNETRPNQREIDAFEGVTSRPPEPVFKTTDTTVRSVQNQAIEDYAGFLKQVGEGNGVAITPDGRRITNNVRFGDTVGKRMTDDMWRDEAERQLLAGKADPEIQKVFDEAADPEVQSLLAKGEQAPVEEGRPIEVKQVNSIPVVKDETVVPTGLPETPGKVRLTEATAPNNAKSAEIAAKTPPALPKEVQNILDNPKQFNKRQVAAARNQRKLARQAAKAQEDTAVAISRIEAAKTGTPQANIVGREEFVPTGKFAKSDQRGGGAYETANRELEVEAGRKEMAARSAEDLVDELEGRRTLAAADQSKIEAAKENIIKSDPDYKQNPLYQVLENRYISDRRKAAQIMALGPRVIRRTASSEAISNRWYNKMLRATDGSNISADEFNKIKLSNDKFTQARDVAARAEEQYKTTRSKADLEAFKKARQEADRLDLEAKTAEVTAAKNTLKGTKSENGAQVISDLEAEAELNMMDAVTASQLSGPATGMRNLYGTELSGLENRFTAPNLRAKIANKFFGKNVGGFSREGAKLGRKEGASRMVSDAKRRAGYSGPNPFKHARNFATTLNSLGESSLRSQKTAKLHKYYENQLKEQGVSGERLKNDKEFLSLTDPDNMGEQFMDDVMKSSGLSGIYQKSRQIELQLAQNIADRLNNVIPPGAANAIAKGITRITLGYPTATGNFVVQSGRRALVGLPSFGEVGYKLARGDKLAAARAFDRGLKEATSGTAAIGTGIALAKADLITGFYPDDPDERAEWEREGKNELSIKINGAWYPIPQGFGMFGLPLILGSTLEEGGPEAAISAFTDRENIFKLLPADQMYGVMQVLSGDSTDNQNKAFVASTIRSLIPMGSFLNQTAKGLDQTVNDTTTKGFWKNVFDQVISGIPGQNLFADIPDKKDDAGNVIKNPNLAQVYSGAQTVEQGAGEARSAEIAGEVSSQLKNIADYGIFDDPVLESILDEDTKQLYNKAKQGEELDESDTKKLKEALVKGVEQSGSDTAYLERGEYDTHLAALKLKRDLMNSDPTVNPSKLKDIDTAIKRGEVYKENTIPYDLIKAYQDISNTEWRNMGDPEDEDHDPEMYETLWKIDELMTKAKVSENDKGKLDKPKYSAKTSGSGRGGRGGRGGRSGVPRLITDFGTLKDGSFAPRVKAYETIDQKSGTIPIIRTVRPNIVHKIGSSR